MTFAPNKNSFYDFTIDIYLIKEAIQNKDKSILKVYQNALDEINSLLENKTTFYDLETRTFDLVSLATRKYSNEFKDKNANLKTLLNIMEENNKKQKF